MQTFDSYIGMTNRESTWLDRIDTERSTTGNYVLNGKDREFCITGEKVGSIKKSELRSRIKKDRVQKLPRRFQCLFDDIALINYSDVDFISESERKELWEQITDVDSRRKTTLGFNLRYGIGDGSEFHFGVEMGSIIRALRQTNADEPSDLIWGFILGMYGLPIESYEIEFQNVNKLLDDLRKMNEERNENIEPVQEHREKNDKLMSNIDIRVERAFEKNGIDPKHIPFSKLELWREMFKLTDLEGDIYDKLEEVINIDQLKESIKLKKTVEKDIESISQEEWRGESAESLINELWLLHNSNNNQRIQVENLTSASNSGTAKKLINQYSSPDKHKEQLAFPIIDKESRGFKLNEYGKLIACCMYDERDTNWILKYKIIHYDPHDLLGSEKLSDEKHKLIKSAIEKVDLNEL